MKKLILLIISFIFLISLTSCDQEQVIETSMTYTYENIKNININTKHCDLVVLSDDSLNTEVVKIQTNNDIDVKIIDNEIEIISNYNKLVVFIFINSCTIINTINYESIVGSINIQHVSINNITAVSKVNNLTIYDSTISYSSFVLDVQDNCSIEKSYINNLEAKFEFIRFGMSISTNNFKTVNYFQNKGNCNFYNNIFSDFKINTINSLCYIELNKNYGYEIEINSKLKKINPELFKIQDNKYIYKDGTSKLNITNGFNYLELKIS